MDGRNKTRILILGGGFGGVTTAQELSRMFRGDRSVEITLVNRDNYFVFVPLLASAAAGSIETLHVVTPIRGLIPGVRFRAEEVVGIDLERKIVTTGSPTTGRERELGYDHLVIALGNMVNLSRIPGAAQHGKTLKTLGDALAIRNHVLQMLEAADIETDPATRREMLTFVVAGGGFSGVEMIGELNDLMRDVLGHYPSIAPEQVKTILLHSNERILPEMSPPVADYAQRELRRRGVEVRLNVRLAGATPHEAVLQDGVKIPTRTLIVAVGNAPPPVVDTLPVEKQRGKVVVDEFLRVPGREGVWALGDNAIVPNRASARGEPSPPTAQYALRQGKTLAYNIAAAVRRRRLKPFAFSGLGLLCLVGHGAGVGELPLGIKMTGFIGWFLWRGVYWSKMPSLARKVQVGLGWLLDLFLPRDIAQVNLSRTQTVGRAHYEPGEYIFRQGDPGDHFYLIAEGEVEVIRERSSGEEVVLGRLGKGEYFGETALLTSRRRNASVRSVTSVDVVTLGRDDFATLANTWLHLAEHVRQVSEKRAAEALPFITLAPGAMPAPQLPGEVRPAARPGTGVLMRRDSGSEVALSRGLISLGRSPDNHVVIGDAQASRRHALIQRDGPTYLIEDLDSPNGTWVNGQRIAERRPLRDGDVIRIGGAELVFQQTDREEPAAAEPSVAEGYLIRATTGEEIALRGDLMGMGRSPDNSILVSDPQSSRRHALIQRNGDGYWLDDLGGANGTWVNERRISERIALQDGDHIRIGQSEFMFHLRRPEASSAPDPAAVTLVRPSANTGSQAGPAAGAPSAAAGPITGLDDAVGAAAEHAQRSGEALAIVPSETVAGHGGGVSAAPDSGPPAASARHTDPRGGRPGAPEPAAATVVRRPVPRPHILLEVSAGPARGKTFELRLDEATIGRAGDNSIALGDDRLSRRHAKIEFNQGAYWLSDLGSTNGTFVNKARIDAPRRLQPDDVIEFGATRLVVHVASGPA